MIPSLYCGIDPGQTGGLGIIDQDGAYVHASRWDKLNPATAFITLQQFKPQIAGAYIETVGLFPGHGIAKATAMQSLLINAGVWRGWLMALHIRWADIHPGTWQKRHGLSRWKSKLDDDPLGPTPLSTARTLWPVAPLQYQADDGKAVGLLLAELARLDIARSPNPPLK